MNNKIRDREIDTVMQTDLYVYKKKYVLTTHW